MGRPKTLTDADFDRQYEAANREPPEPLALHARYRADLGLVWVELSNECVFAFPPRLVEALSDAPERTVAGVEVLDGGCGLRWDSLDLDLSVAGLLLGSFGTRAWMQEIGRKGGRSTSDAKADAARRNGRKGGRPRAVSQEEVSRVGADARPESEWLYGASTEPATAHSVEVPVVAEQTPSSRTPAQFMSGPFATHDARRSEPERDDDVQG